MASVFIQMITEWRDRRYSQYMQVLSRNKIPCGLFISPSVPDNIQGHRNFFKGRELNLTCICVMNEEDKQRVQPAEGETLVTLKEYPDLKAKPRIMFLSAGGFFPLMFADYFKRFGTDMFGFNGRSNAENMYDYYMKHLPELCDVHEMFSDEESKKVFRAFMTARVTNLIKDFRFAPEPQYFLEGFFPTIGDIAIDGGAFDGATSADFARQGATVYAFEMSADNYKNCLNRAKKETGGGGGTAFSLRISA